MRVLVVEDEARMAGLLKRALQEEGHAVDVAADGQEGLWLATENAYGAIVLDVMLPGLDGFQVCRRLRELAARLRALARRDDRSRPVILVEGDLRLDPAAKRAWRAGTELHLSPKEFALLEFFLRHPGVVLTRSQLIEAVWDFAYDGGSNVVDQYVNYLRRKIGRHDIETVRGMGYRLRHAQGG